MKIWLFRTIALTIPLLFFVFLEIALRIAGFGQSYPVFIQNPANPDYILPRPDLLQRYFAEDAQPPAVTMEANFLLKAKPDNGLRIFVQGGSSAAGFPYGLGASLAGMLDKRLKQTFPTRTVEVVNTAMAAVNSYTLLDIAEEIIQQQPDAVLIYAGHNEFLGILGVGSNYTAANSQATTLLFLKVKELRFFQLMQWLYQQFQSQAETIEDTHQSRTFMAKVAKHKNIEYGSERYQAGLDQFETNLNLLLQKYKDADVPVYVATLASNILDQTPFASTPIPESANQVLSKTPDVSQLQQLAQNFKDSDSADLFFAIGRGLAARGDIKGAKTALSRAKDLDLLRFRAPEAINLIIRQVASEKGAIVVEAQQRFEQRAGGLVGNNLMLEHLHPNVQGYFLLSDAFYQSLKTNQTFGQWQDVPIQQAWSQKPLLPAEEYYGFAKVRQLMSDYPFTDKPMPLVLPKPADWQQQLGAQYFAKQIDWPTMTKLSLEGYKNKDKRLQATAMQLLADALPHDSNVNSDFANWLIKERQPALAAQYFLRAVKAEQSPSKQLLRRLIRAYQTSNQDELASKWLARLKEINDE